MPRWPLALVAFVPALALGGEIAFENARLRVLLGDDACWRSIVDKATGKDYAVPGQKARFASARVAEKWCDAASAALAGDQLTIGFTGVDTRLTYAVETRPDWIAFRLVGVAGTRPSELTLVRVATSLAAHVGPRLNGAWDDRFAIALMAINLQTQGGARRVGAYAELATTTQDAPGPRLEGAAAALVGTPMPVFREVLQRLAVAYGLPRNSENGVASHDLPIARGSYWFLDFGEADVDRVIELCRQTGIRQVMLSSGSWCRSPGHYLFNLARYPDGLESLRRTVARLHAAGILVGMHCFASKISKIDPYVTPVPDRRFWVDLSAVLAADVNPSEAAIRTSSDLSQWPGSPVCKQTMWEGGVIKHQEVILDDEIIRYKAIGSSDGKQPGEEGRGASKTGHPHAERGDEKEKGKWNTFLGCERGAWGTRPAAHKAGTQGRHYGVDGCINGYIIDQETTLLDEVTTRLGDIFNTCGFDMVYFDGGEDVDRRRFTYYVSKFQAVAMSKFTKRPLIHMGTIFTHNLWHSFTRSGTVDTYLNTLYGHIQAGGKIETWPTVRDHIDRSVQYMLSVREDLIPGELGWFGIWPKGKNTDGLQLDEAEYLMCKSLAYDAPISLQTSFRQMESHPLTPGILEIVKAYEDLRAGGKVHEVTRRRLRQQGRDFILVPMPGEPWFIEAMAVPQVAGTQDIRAFVGESTWMVSTGYAAVWHYAGREGKLILNTDRLKASEIAGAAVETEKLRDGKTVVPIGGRRTTLRFQGLSADNVRELLRTAELQLRPPGAIWLQAEDAVRIVGKMVKGSEVGAKDPEAFGDIVLCMDQIDRAQPKDCYCEYRVEIPHKGRWTLWARVRYPSGADESFGIVLPGEKVALEGKQVLGNCGQNAAKWHWTGRGGGSTTPPPGEPITFDLPAGPFVFRIYPREGGGTAAANPRLDAFCLTDDPAYVPTDADATAALKNRKE